MTTTLIKNSLLYLTNEAKARLRQNKLGEANSYLVYVLTGRRDSLLSEEEGELVGGLVLKVVQVLGRGVLVTANSRRGLSVVTILDLKYVTTVTEQRLSPEAAGTIDGREVSSFINKKPGLVAALVQAKWPMSKEEMQRKGGSLSVGATKSSGRRSSGLSKRAP